MDQRINNYFKGGNIEGDYVGGNQTKNYYISMFQDSEREFVVTHNADIKPVSYFTGRETELQELRKRIEKGRKSVLVSGMGGIGKTHICRKLFEEYLDKHADGEDIPFCHIGYIEYNRDMDSSLQNCLNFKHQDNPEQNQEAAWKELEYLASDGKLLLFIDNVNVPIGEDIGLERLKSIPGAIVLTSRRTSFSKEFESYRIGFLSTEQCKVIYEKIQYEDSGKKVSGEEVRDLEYVIEEMVAGHTITIEFLAHLARANNWTATTLRKELESRSFCLKYNKYDEDRFISIQKEYEKLYDLSELTKAEQNILEAFSVFPYIPLEAEICYQWLIPDAGAAIEDGDILVGLYRKGWLQFDMKQESYAMHPVFAWFIYDKCKPKAEEHSALIDGCEKCLEIPDSGMVLECQKFIPFAESIVEKLAMGYGLMRSLASLLCNIGEFDKAEKLSKKNMEICEKIIGKSHSRTAFCYNDLAGVYDAQGKYKEAEELYKKSLRIKEKVYGKWDSSTATGYNNLAYVYGRQGNYKEAEELHKKALRIRESVLGEQHPDTASSYNNLAVVYRNLGKYKEAEELHKKALRIRENVLGEQHPDTASSYNNLAILYKNQGKHKEAEELYKKALRIRESVLGEQHPNTASSYNNLAILYENQGKHKEAEELYKKALRIREKALGEGHSDTATSTTNN